jgi:hypothetical protein
MPCHVLGLPSGHFNGIYGTFGKKKKWKYSEGTMHAPMVITVN